MEPRVQGVLFLDYSPYVRSQAPGGPPPFLTGKWTNVVGNKHLLVC